MGGAYSTYGGGEVHTGIWWENVMGKDNLENLGIDGKVILRRIFRKWNGGAWTGLIWLRIETGGWLL